MVIADRWGGFFGSLRNLMGVKRLCELFFDDPALIEEMMDADADFLVAMLDQLLEETDIDVFGFWEDMAFRTSTLLSPAMARRFMLPRYRRVIEFGRSRGAYFGLDSDGQIDPLIPVWMDAGIDILYPFEVQADMDVLAVRTEVWQVVADLGRRGQAGSRLRPSGDRRRAPPRGPLDRGGRLRAHARPQRHAQRALRELLLLHGPIEALSVMITIEPFAGRSDIERLLAALRGKKTDRVPNFEILIEDQHVEPPFGTQGGEYARGWR